MELIDFSIYPASDVQYGGSGARKRFWCPNGGGRPCEYMLKFRKRTPLRHAEQPSSEYLGSRIFEVLGYPTQKVFLGLRHGEEVVACKSFVADGKQFVPFSDVGESTLDGTRNPTSTTTRTSCACCATTPSSPTLPKRSRCSGRCSSWTPCWQFRSPRHELGLHQAGQCVCAGAVFDNGSASSPM